MRPPRRRAADDCGVPLVINARVDTYLRTVGNPATRLADTVNRATAYLDAGADSIFLIGAGVAAAAAAVQAIDAPVNVLAEPDGTTVAEWASHGVARISTGPALAQLAYAAVHSAARELPGTGRTRSLTYGEADRFARRGRIWSGRLVWPSGLGRGWLGPFRAGWVDRAAGLDEVDRAVWSGPGLVGPVPGWAG